MKENVSKTMKKCKEVRSDGGRDFFEFRYVSCFTREGGDGFRVTVKQP